MRACEEAGIEFVLGKSEPSCAFMADAVYQLTGRPAVLIPALGPGISNAMSGIAGAMQERSAIAVLCGEMATKQMGVYNHQVFDHVALARPVTKYAENLNPRRAAQQLAKALDIALAYPAGPVFLNVPADYNRDAAAGEEPKRPAQRAVTALASGFRRSAARETCRREAADRAGRPRCAARRYAGRLQEIRRSVEAAVLYHLQGERHHRGRSSAVPRQRRPFARGGCREPRADQGGRLHRAGRLRSDRAARRVAGRLAPVPAGGQHRLGCAQPPDLSRGRRGARRCADDPRPVAAGGIGRWMDFGMDDGAVRQPARESRAHRAAEDARERHQPGGAVPRGQRPGAGTTGS